MSTARKLIEGVTEVSNEILKKLQVIAKAYDGTSTIVKNQSATFEFPVYNDALKFADEVSSKFNLRMASVGRTIIVYLN